MLRPYRGMNRNCIWYTEAIDDSPYSPKISRSPGNVGIFGGPTSSNYLVWCFEPSLASLFFRLTLTFIFKLMMCSTRVLSGECSKTFTPDVLLLRARGWLP